MYCYVSVAASFLTLLESKMFHVLFVFHAYSPFFLVSPNSELFVFSALYVVDLKRFRSIAAGDRLRGQYQV